MSGRADSEDYNKGLPPDSALYSHKTFSRQIHMRDSTLLAFSVLCLAAVFTASAQMPFERGEQRHLFGSGDLDGLAPVPHDYREAFSAPSSVRPAPTARPLYTSPEGITLWGNVVYARSWGDDGELPGFSAYNYSSSGLGVSQVVQDEWIFANGSGAFYDGKFRFISKGYTTYLYAVYDVSTWTQTYQEMSTVKFQKLVASDCDYDPITGLTYGCFWNPDTQEYEFASVDYESCTHTTISPMEIFSAIAIDSKGVIYGIKESDGGLYIIDKETGALTFVGPTGIQPYLIQSAAFDRSNDVLYWAVRQTGSVAYLARVNTDTGAATRLAYFPDNEQITCLFVPPSAVAGAPGAVTGLKADIRPGGTDVTMRFTMPTADADGISLADATLEYQVTLAGKEIKTGKASPGAQVETVFAAPEGYSAITVTASGDKGRGIPVERRIWCGADTPSKVTDVAVSVDSDNLVSLSWKGSETGIHGGYIGLSALSYDVIRMPEGKVVSSRQKETSFSETLGQGMAGSYHYVVIPYAGDLAGEPAESSRITAIGAFAVPYNESFDSEAGFESFMTVDSNGDSKTWYWNSQMQLAQYYVNWSKDADDWLLTPEIAMEKDRLYVLSFDCRGWNGNTAEKLAVAIGKGTDPSAYTDIMPITEIRSGDMQTCRLIFRVPEDGDYRIGYHCTSPRTAMYVLIDNISVTDGISPTAPGMVTALTVVPDPTGLLSADIVFTTPSADVLGNALTSPVDVEICRNDTETPVAVLSGLEPGKEHTYTDTDVIDTGINRYVVRVSGNGGKGLPAESSVYVGQDRPMASESVTLQDNGDHYMLSWAEPSAEGVSYPPHPVIPSSLTYNVYSPDQALLAEGIEGLSFRLPESYVTGEQGLLSFYVTGVSPAGEGAMASSNAILTGKPYDLPFRESFRDGVDPDSFWWIGGGNPFYPSADKAYDGDGGCIRWKDSSWEKTTWFNSAKLNISSAQSPSLQFAYWAIPGKHLKISTYISPEGGEDIFLGETDFMSETGDEGWRLASFDLTPHKEGKFAIVKLYVESQETYDYYNPLYLYLDQICVVDTDVANLTAAALSAPSTLYAGQTGQISVVVQNSASKGVGYKVSMYVDGVAADSREIPYIGPLSQETVSFSYTPSVLSDASVSFHAEIECADDLFPADNTTGSAVTDILIPDYPVVTDLTASFGNGAVVLNWSEPACDLGVVSESFEDYTHKDTNFGFWTTVDQDLGWAFTNQIVDVGYHNVPMAWAVFNSIAAGVSEDEAQYYEAHTGTTSLLAFASQPETVKRGVGNDDWLISPELSCTASHLLTFWAKAVKGDKYGPESFEVLYTRGFPNETGAFVSLGTFSAPQSWTEYSLQIPEGARFFAIRYRTLGGFYMMLDDIEFERGMLEVTGYSIFRDGKKIAEVPGAANSISDFTADVNEKHTYTVTVKYSNGESGMSNEALTDMSGVDGVRRLRECPFDVFSADGIMVRGNATDLKDLPRGVYIVNGKKVIK